MDMNGKEPQPPTETPDAFISRAGEEQRETLMKALHSLGGNKTGDELDCEYLVRSVRALLTTNDDIWEECESFACPESCGFVSDNTIWFHRLSTKDIFFKTETAGETEDETDENSSSDEEESDEEEKERRENVFSTLAVQERKCFKLPWPLPSALVEILSPPLLSGDRFYPDYGNYLRKVTFLREDIMAPFLAILQDHLEKVQVALGKIQTWLLESEKRVDVIKTHFEEEGSIDLKRDIDSFHKIYGTKKRPREGSHKCRYCSRSFTSRYYELKRIKACSKSDFDEEFDVSTESGQRKLEKFLDFLSVE